MRREFIEEWAKSERAGEEAAAGGEADAAEEEEKGSSVTRELQGVYGVDGIGKRQ